MEKRRPLKNFFKFFLVVTLRYLASFFEKTIDEFPNIFDSEEEENSFVGYEKPHPHDEFYSSEETPEVSI